ncbi:hypothetical protein BZZ01_15980 [Nostocales cyanobacterium HT-58-2]|nr:hypothetical protein BZZ01_15980 [Nostocales cyanobacterium HT-58-2]
MHTVVGRIAVNFGEGKVAGLPLIQESPGFRTQSRQEVISSIDVAAILTTTNTPPSMDGVKNINHAHHTVNYFVVSPAL